eukprot:gnl/TRDRNA2_/TRDRNA2_177468_c6_seq5.p1 gnl/TRDRNA2_/TRDRNA2_177468_c6~~gnl/TRDRNA2_/TRDRNA2_177468_c6_seq5.p1  ORF type:complete len:976 (-),score=226.53 gnl/TRDRNA2_/TRDRNA2_177468_c6_seq5:63-2576(-)
MLNDMALSAQARLDRKMIECWEFKEKNREMFAQATSDLSRLGATISDAERLLLKSQWTKAETDETTQHTEEQRRDEQIAHDKRAAMDKQDLSVKTKDLQEAEFMLGFVDNICSTTRSKRSQTGPAHVGIIKCTNGTVQFHNADLRRSSQQLSESGRKMLESAFARAPFDDGGVQAAHAVAEATGAFIEDGLDDGDQVQNKMTAGVDGHGIFRVGPHLLLHNRAECTLSKLDCGMLVDKIVGLYGDMKDLVEAKEAEMQKNDQAWSELNENFNSQIRTLTMQMGQAQSDLAGAYADKSTQTDQQASIQQESQALEDEYTKTMSACKKQIKHILHSDIHGILKVRNDILSLYMPKEEALEATDCEVGEWVKGECSSPCDEKMAGGTQILTREVITLNTPHGHACPDLTLKKKCNEFKCPVDCELGEWSGWSKCTKECGGGVQARTRAVIVKPKDGGTSCETLQESQSCNTFSCDRDCTLKKWTKWTPCTKACDEGFQERFRHIKRPVRANGFCFKKDSKERYQKVKCNTQACVGDEMCIAALDLIIGVDASGSISEKGFDILKTFAKMLVSRYEPEAYGNEATKIGVIQFGNGKLDDVTKVVSDAALIHPLSTDYDSVKGAIGEMHWSKGFTNMAQAFMKATAMIQRSPRTAAAGTFVMITDGKPSFTFATDKAVKSYKGRGRSVIVQVKQYASTETKELMRKYASKPWQTNYLLINGKAELKSDYGKYVDKVLVSSCPRAESVKANAALKMEDGFEKLYEGWNCAGEVATLEVENVAACNGAVVEFDGGKSFAYGEDPATMGGHCLIYDKVCEGDALLPNKTYEVFVPFIPEEPTMAA